MSHHIAIDSSLLSRRGSPWLHAALVCAAGLVCATAQAQGTTRTPPRLEVEALPSAWQDTQAPALRRDAITQAAYGQANDRLRARWWWRRGSVELGAGADYWKTSNGGAAVALNANPVLGLRTELSANTHLVYELSSFQDTQRLSGLTTERSRVALEFKGRASERANLPAGFLRVQLSGGSTLQLRPRGGGLSMAYRSRF